MPAPYRGGCACGAVRYEIDAEPLFAGHCQCRDCQRESGGGHTSLMGFPAEAVKWTGTPRFFAVKADSGETVRRGFCANCGSPLGGAPGGYPGVVTIRVGSLDDPSVFRPEFVCYTSRGHAWDVVDPALAMFTALPPEDDNQPQSREAPTSTR